MVAPETVIDCAEAELQVAAPLTPGSNLWGAFEATLRAAGLPVDDLHEPGQHFFVLQDGAAFGGFALGGPTILLRSLVVLPAHRGNGLGRSLLEMVLGAARVRAAREAWLLTTTASAFFQKAGFVEAERSAAPSFVASSRQFSTLCPSSAVLMCRPLA